MMRAAQGGGAAVQAGRPGDSAKEGRAALPVHLLPGPAPALPATRGAPPLPFVDLIIWFVFSGFVFDV